MGNTPISVPETEIYYPSDWLVNGGPPFNTMNCPDYEVDEDCDGHSVLSIVYDWDIKKWYVLSGLHGADAETRRGTVVMESTNLYDVSEYFRSYMASVKRWQQKYENNDWGTK